MKTEKIKCRAVCLLAALFLGAATAGIYLTNDAYASADNEVYGESYRNQLAYSAAAGWNNDPNGLLYVNGTYHMYYQYTWDGSQTQTWWDHMSWGHATSTDLVHWEEQPVAIPAYQWDGDGNYYAMMFSGSAVYDEYNTSGLFDIDSSGKVATGQGIIAVLTQPLDEAGGQRQILAYSKDNGQNFTIYGEIVGADADGDIGDGEFRDPKVFWNENLGKWLMAVGGGSVRMYSSDNLLEWDYLGETGYWGECPDISRFVVDGEEKYVLIISPEDKAKSHEYNGTNRAETYYPAEYYVVGELNEDGLFVSSDGVHRLSEGIDSYAFQSFNNQPDGKVYGISWAASWKSVGEYESFRQVYNGGMTVVCELNLVQQEGEYVLLRTPVAGYDELRGERLIEYQGQLSAGTNALAGVNATEADVEIMLDFTDSSATYAELSLRVSAAERIILRYDAVSQILTLDRSESSLLAADTSLYRIAYEKATPLKDGKLTLRILLDRAFISVFANGGETTLFSAVFPAAISDGMRLLSDGNLGVDAVVYAVESIFGEHGQVDDFIVTTDKIDTTVGTIQTVIASSYADGFNPSAVTYTVTEGSENVSLTYYDGIAYIRSLKKGFARVRVEYLGRTSDVDVYIYENGYVGDVSYDTRIGGFALTRDDGLYFSTGTSDAFLFSDTTGASFIYSAHITRENEGAQAAGLVFGASDNLSNYWVATADFKDNKIKLWQAGVGDLKVADCDIGGLSSIKLTVVVNGDVVKIYVNDGATAALTCQISGYSGGRVGVNVYNAEIVFNRVVFENVLVGENTFNFGANEIIKVVNVTDGSYRLQSGDYTVTEGVVCISQSYLATLEPDTTYTFRIVTSLTDFDVTVTTDFAAATLISAKDGYLRGEEISLILTGNTTLYRLELDGKEVNYTVENNTIILSAEETGELTAGTHTLKAYTSNGRPTVGITVSGLADDVWQEVEEISHTFFYIDIAVFAALIAAYLIFTVIKRLRKKKKASANA